MIKSTKNGFTLIEALFSILVSTIVASIAIVYLQCCMHLVQIKPLHQNQFAILQIRQIVSLAHDVHIDGNKLVMIYKHNTISFEEDRNRLVQREGYQIWMEGISHVRFTKEKDEIFIRWIFNGKEYKSQLY